MFRLQGRMQVIGVATLVVILAIAQDVSAATSYAVGPQYDSTHVYVSPQDFDKFVASFVATFGGTTSAKGVVQVTPTESKTMSQLALSQAGTVSTFGFVTPIPHPFGLERTGYLVTDMDGAIRAAKAAGASVVVAPFPDPIGRDAVILWPGGVYMQLYWHTKPPTYGALASVPENRVYISPDRVDAFVEDFSAFALGRVVEDNGAAPGSEIGQPGKRYRRVRIESTFGNVTVFATDGHLPYPYGVESTGYEVPDLGATLKRATDSGATVLVSPFTSDGRQSAMVQFPGGYIAEVHSKIAK